MKVLSQILLYLFLLSLATPTIISIVNNDDDFSAFYSMSEEENSVSLDLNEIKTIPTIYSIPIVIDFEGSQKAKFSILNDRKVNSIAPNIFLRPPEIV